MRFSDRVALATLPLPFTTLGVSILSFGSHYLPELYLLAWCIIALGTSRARARVAATLVTSRQIIISLAVVTFVALLSGFRDDFNLISFYGRWRALLLAVCGLMIVYASIDRKWNDKLEDCLIVLCGSACLMYIAQSLIYASNAGTKAPISMICFSIVVYLLCIRRKYASAITFSFLACIAAYLSFFRQNYLTSLALLSVAILYLTFVTVGFRKGSVLLRSSSWVLGASLIALTLIIGLTWANIYEFLTSSESRYIQSVGKTTDLIDSLRAGELDESGNSRISDYSYLADSFPYYFLPNGLIDDSSLQLYSLWGGQTYEPGISVVRDSILAYLIVTFGFALCFCMTAYAALSLYKAISRHPSRAITRLVFISPACAAAFFLDGASLTQFQKSLFFGIAIAMILPKPSSEPFRGRLGTVNLS